MEMDSHCSETWPEDTVRLVKTHLQLLHCREGEEGRGSSWDSGVVDNPQPAEERSPCARTLQLIDLKSHSPLPHGWEQFLDLQSGEIYYIDRSLCKVTRIDPRNSMAVSGEMEEVRGVLSCVSACGTTTIKEDTEAESRYTGNAPLPFSHVHNSNISPHKLEMVVSGCWQCLNYVMYPKDAPLCPNCKASLVKP